MLQRVGLVARMDIDLDRLALCKPGRIHVIAHCRPVLICTVVKNTEHMVSDRHRILKEYICLAHVKNNLRAFLDRRDSAFQGRSVQSHTLTCDNKILLSCEDVAVRHIQPDFFLFSADRNRSPCLCADSLEAVADLKVILIAFLSGQVNGSDHFLKRIFFCTSCQVIDLVFFRSIVFECQLDGLDRRPVGHGIHTERQPVLIFKLRGRLVCH